MRKGEKLTTSVKLTDKFDIRVLARTFEFDGMTNPLGVFDPIGQKEPASELGSRARKKALFKSTEASGEILSL